MNRPLINKSGEVRELEHADFTNMRPAREVMGADFMAMTRTRSKQKSPTKTPITLRLDPDILAHFKADGKGYQTRINDALREWIANHS